MHSLFKRTHILLSFLLLLSCAKDADRDNPLDPQSRMYESSGNLAGYVYTYYLPFQPIASALISLNPGNQTTITNQKGEFAFINIEPGRYIVTATYPNYASDTAQVEIQSNRTTSKQFNLDGLPQLDTLILRSGFQHEHFPFTSARMIEVTAQVHDPDGPADIAAVVIIIPSIGFKDTLDITHIINTYQKKIEEKDLTVKRIEELIGLPVYVEITDKVGKLCRFGPLYLFRVIAEEPEIISPKGSASVGIQPILKWKSIQLPFLFTIKVEIYAIREDQILYPAIYSFSNISSEISEFRIATILPASLYLWAVSIVDTWGNWSRSKPATFQVGE